MNQPSYIWTIGYRDNGDPMISGPFINEDDAADGTGHLSNVKFVKLATRDRAKALPQLRDRVRHGARRVPTPPRDDATKSSIIQKVLHPRLGRGSRVLRHSEAEPDHRHDGQEKDDNDDATA